MSSSSWQHYEHEADIGVHGIGTTKAEAFIQASLAMIAVICELDTIRPELKIDIDCKAPDDELLLVDWLNALIYQMSSHKLLFSRFEVEIESGQLHGSAWSENIDPARHQPAVEIKGATNTTLSVHQDDEGYWHAQTVVDV